MKLFYLAIENINNETFRERLLALSPDLALKDISLATRDIRHLASLALMRRMLVENMILSENEAGKVEIKRHPSGEPYLSDTSQKKPDLPFISISHSGPWIACVLSDPLAPACIDIEDLTHKRPFEKISAHAFTEAEHQFVLKEGVMGFYKLWTAKEALAKCQGKGLSEVLKLTLDPHLALFETDTSVHMTLKGSAYTLVLVKLPSNVFYTIAQREC